MHLKRKKEAFANDKREKLKAKNAMNPNKNV